MSQIDERLHRKTVRATLATRVTVVVVILLGVAVVVLQLRLTASTNTVARGIAAQQKTNTSSVTNIKHLARQIESCTTPGEPCSNRGQRQTAKAVGDINQVVILASACAVGVDPKLSVSQRQVLIQSCVINRLATGGRSPR